MRRHFIFAFLLLANLCSAQIKTNVYYLKNDGRYVTTRDSADYMRVVAEPDSGSTLYNVVEFYPDGKKKSVGQSSTIDPQNYVGQRIEYFHNGARKRVSVYKGMSIVDDEFLFYPNQKPYMVIKHPSEPGERNGSYYDDDLITANYDSTGATLATNGMGSFRLYDDDFKNVIESGGLKNGKRDSVCAGVDHDDKWHFVEKYSNNVLISGTLTDEKGIVTTYTQKRWIAPDYPGGLTAFYKYLAKKIHYPGYEFNNNITGTIMVSFVVEKDGKVSNIKLLHHLTANLDREAMRVMKESPQWIPGTNYGRPVRVTYQVPISFSLSE